LIRGTIAEKVPGGEVVIVTLAGEVRRFPMADVEYAGPRPQQPQADRDRAQQASMGHGRSEHRVNAASSAAIRPRDAQIHFVADQPRVRFHRLTGTGSATITGSWARLDARHYDVICSAPCTTTISPGTHTLALTLGDRSPVEVKEPLVVGGDARVSGIYHSRRGLRVAGWLLWAAGLVAGSAMMAANIGNDSLLDQNEERDYSLTIGGAVVMGVTSIAGLIMAFQRDKAEIQVSAR
jgi:hypothetical protein